MTDGEQDSEEFNIATITIEYKLWPDGQDVIETEAVDANDERPPLVQVLGMLDLARDSLIRMYMGEDDTDEDEEDEDEEA